MLLIEHLLSGGIITNYYCTSSCRHCLYRCSPYWPKDYMTKEMARNAFETCKRLGCFSVHIGGGEPFLNLQGLLSVLEAARDSGISIEYVETNSSWFTDAEKAVSILEKVKGLGVSTLLVSASPFHLEFIPFKKVLGVVEACKYVGMKPFLWTEAFFNLFQGLDPSKRYTIHDLEIIFGKDKIRQMISSYWIHPGGRALETFFDSGFTFEELLERYQGGCQELSDTSHFHMDLYGNYIPGLCSGLAVETKDLGKPLDPSKYPICSILYEEGIRGLFRYASSKGFMPSKGRQYGAKCSLCFHMRSFLFRQGESLHELAPNSHYKI